MRDNPNNGCLIVFAVAGLTFLAWLMMPEARTMTKPEPLPADDRGVFQARTPLPAAVRAPQEAAKAPTVTDPALGMAYVEANLDRAKAGDHRAQYHVGRILSYCAVTYHVYQATGRLEPDGHDWTFCNSFEHGPPDYADGEVWSQQALEGEDPLAVLMDARNQFFSHSGQRGTRERLDAAIAMAQSSTDPEVQAMLELATVAANLPEVP